jgi:hypothetical protein
MKTRLSKPLSLRAKSFKSAGFESSCEAGGGRLVSAAKVGAADASDRTTARLKLEKRDIIFSLLGCSLKLGCSSASEDMSSDVLLYETPIPGLLATALPSHRPIDRLSVSCYAAQIDFVTIALKHAFVTLALRYFDRALGSENTPGWLTEESVLAVFRR